MIKATKYFRKMPLKRFKKIPIFRTYYIVWEKQERTRIESATYELNCPSMCCTFSEKISSFHFPFPRELPTKQERFQRKQEPEIQFLFLYISLTAIDTFHIS